MLKYIYLVVLFTYERNKNSKMTYGTTGFFQKEGVMDLCLVYNWGEQGFTHMQLSDTAGHTCCVVSGTAWHKICSAEVYYRV